MHFVEHRGISIQSQFHGFQRREIPTLSGFFEGLQECFVTQSKRVYLQVGNFSYRKRAQF